MCQDSLLSPDKAGEQLLYRTELLLHGCSFKLVKDRIAVFVCGGAPKQKPGQPLTWRAAFLEWMRKQNETTRLDVILAEKAYDAAIQSEGSFLNISDFETILADLSDCILLFPESAGSYAEAGIFASSNRKIYQKVLVANEAQHHNSSSFLSLGPLHSFSAKSRYSQAVVLAEIEKTDNPAFHIIRQRIEERALKNRTAIQWSSSKSLNLRERLAVVLLLIKTAGILSEADIRRLLKAIQLTMSDTELKQIFRILLMFKQVERSERQFYRFLDNNNFEATIEGTKGHLSALSASYRDYYLQKFPRLLAGESGGAKR